ncbi:MAG: acetate--CoA ligase family protein [Pseudomonadota bacterium]
MPQSATGIQREFAMNHWLTRMLEPQSIAIVGASERPGSLALITYRQLVDSQYPGTLYSVNPKYETLFNQPCYPSLRDLPTVPDLVVYAISGLPLEQSFEEALALGVGGIVMYAANYLEEDSAPPLPERLRQKAVAAGIPVCGGNSMGFYNYDNNTLVSFDSPPSERPAGHIGLIAHSGSAMTYLANNDARFAYNYVIGSGQETNASVGDYVDYLLEQSSTRVIALFLESVRDESSFVNALRKAQQRNIPIVILKLGRTEKSAELAISHSGAIVGDHDAFVALCRKHNAILVHDIDELIITAYLFSLGYQVPHGGVASMLDSGGMRELMIDIGEDHGVHFADVSNNTLSRIREQLEPGLVADNPLDAMGALGRNSEQTYLSCGQALFDDPATGLLTFEFEFRDGFSQYPEIFNTVRALHKHSDKPLILLNSLTYTTLDATAAELTREGVAVINGIDVGLRAIRNLMTYGANQNSSTTSPAKSFDNELAAELKNRIQYGEVNDESSALLLLGDAGLPTVEQFIATDESALLDKAKQFGYPVVLKTAAPDIAHKSDVGGVRVGITSDEELQMAYRDISERLGPRVLLMPQIEGGVELALGMKRDPQFGPMVMLSAGGIMIELLGDVAARLAPVNEQEARDMIAGLRIRKMLDGFRGKPTCDIDSLVDVVVRFSGLVANLTDSVAEIDLNPILVSDKGCTIVDALIVPEQS